MRMKKRRSIGSLVTYMLAVSVFLACCCTGALAVTENEASLVSEETGNTIEIPYAFGTLGGGLSDILLDGVSVQSVDYEIKLLPDADQVIKGERFAVEVLIDSETQETFGGAQGLLTYDKSLVHYEGVATKDADFDCSENAEGIMIAGAGAEKKISEDGYSIITLYFTALEDLAEEEYEAEFQLSDTMIAVNGQLTGKIPYSQKAVVRIVDEDFSNTYAITLPEEAVEVTGVTDGLVTVGTDVTFKVIGENNRVFVKIGDEAEKELVANGPAA